MDYEMNDFETVSSKLVSDDERVATTAKLFGFDFPMRLEPTVYAMAGMLATKYQGGFYLAPDTGTIFEVNCQNGFQGQLSGDALGVTACLFSYSQLSFGQGEFAQTCARHYHLLRDFAMDHSEAGAILRATD